MGNGLQMEIEGDVSKIGRVDFFGLSLSVFTKEQLSSYLIDCIKDKKIIICFGYSFGYIPLFKKLPELYHMANDYDVMVTDGRQFYLFAKMLGAPLKYDISIPFLSKLILKIANEYRFSIIIIGSDEKTNSAATENVRRDYPNALVYDGLTGGNFSIEHQEQTVEQINKLSPDIVFIGASSPKKEIFASKWKNKLNTKIIVPLGGMIDGLAGKVWLTPPILKKLGLATLIRVFQEPRRLLWINLWFAYETLFRIIPKTIWEVKCKKNKDFFIPSIYKIKKQY